MHRSLQPYVCTAACSPVHPSLLPYASQNDEGEVCAWTPVKFDATTAKDTDGLTERAIISYAGAVQLRCSSGAARAWGRAVQGLG